MVPPFSPEALPTDSSQTSDRFGMSRYAARFGNLLLSSPWVPRVCIRHKLSLAPHTMCLVELPETNHMARHRKRKNCRWNRWHWRPPRPQDKATGKSLAPPSLRFTNLNIWHTHDIFMAYPWYTHMHGSYWRFKKWHRKINNKKQKYNIYVCVFFSGRDALRV